MLRSTRCALLLLLSFAAQTLSAATLTVTSTADSGAGSLRNAIATAAPGDVINFSLTSPATITLSSTWLVIDKNLTITGPGSASLHISGNDTVPVFHVNPGVTASIAGVTIEHGHAWPTTFRGGGIFNEGTLTLANCVVTNNGGGSDQSDDPCLFGAGIANFNGSTLTLNDTTVSNNTGGPGCGEGGGISNQGATLNVNRSMISGNAAVIGGAIYNVGSTLTIVDSDISGNSSTNLGEGTAIYNQGGSASVSRTLFDGNGDLAIWTTLSNFSMSNSTLRNGFRGFIHFSGNANLSNNTFVNTITQFSSFFGALAVVKANLFVNADCPVFDSPTVSSLGYNIVASDSSSCGLSHPSDRLISQAQVGLDPNGLQDNGGPTKTIALQPGSVALDVIPAAQCTDVFGAPLTVDQRGIARPQNGACDAGAFERKIDAGATPTGTNVAVQPTDTTTGQPAPVTMSFSNVTTAGSTSVTSTTSGPPPPTGFKLGNPPAYFNLSTTAVFSGAVTVCFNYTGVSYNDPTKLRLLHNANGTWVDITTSNDTTAHIICGSTPSLSPFGVFESSYSSSVQPPIAANGSSVFEANRGSVPVKFDLKIDGASTCQLPPATIAVTRTAGAATGPINWSSFDVPSDDGPNFRVTGCQYLYNVDAKGLGPGTYLVQIIIDGVAAGGATFGLR